MMISCFCLSYALVMIMTFMCQLFDRFYLHSVDKKYFLLFLTLKAKVLKFGPYRHTPGSIAFVDVTQSEKIQTVNLEAFLGGLSKGGGSSNF